MRYELMNAVIMAENYEKLRDWYVKALDLEVLEEHTDRFHYAELAKDGRLVFGIADAAEMGVEPSTPRASAVVGQLNTDDVKAFLAQVKERGGDLPFGPSYDKEIDLWFGGFADPEGNQHWVVQMPALLSEPKPLTE